MYTCIPVLKSIEIMCNILSNKNIPQDTIQEFRHLILLCLKENLCMYGNVIYQFPDGLPMGGPLSCLVAEVFMDYLEHKLFETFCTPHVVEWIRYVDDILCVWNGSEDQLRKFLDSLNSLEPTISFTLEIGGRSLNFLDLTISLLPPPPSLPPSLSYSFHPPSPSLPQSSSSLPHPSSFPQSSSSLPHPSSSSSSSLFPHFAIYRKPSNSGVLIHGDSFHHFSHKLAAFHSMIHRLLSIPLSSASFQSELDVISHLADKNHIPLNIHKIIRRKLLCRALRSISISPSNPLIQSTPASRDKWVRLPFLGSTSQHIASQLQKLGYKIAYYSLLRVGHLSVLKDPTPPSKLSGIYRAICRAPSCNAAYVGQTGRTLQQRISEHRAAYGRAKNQDSAIANHCLTARHDFSNIEFELIHRATKGRLLNQLEMTETVKLFNNESYNALNDLQYMYIHPLVTFMFGQIV